MTPFVRRRPRPRVGSSVRRSTPSIAITPCGSAWRYRASPVTFVARVFGGSREELLLRLVAERKLTVRERGVLEAILKEQCQ